MILTMILLHPSCDSFNTGESLRTYFFLSFLDVLRGLPLRAITLRTYSDLGEDAWTLLNTFTNLQKVEIWSMNGPPRVLQGWAPLLGGTLTELELGVGIHFVRDPHHGIFTKVSIHAM